MKISAVIIVKNEELMIEECLQSIEWLHDYGEILIVDTGCTDKTIDIAKKYKVRVVKTTNEDKTFSAWRNVGLKQALGDWILYLDADERITPELKKEILDSIDSDRNIVCYAIPRRNIILGKELRHGGWYPDFVKRLYKKESLQRWIGDLHEEPQFKGQMVHMRSAMIHIKHETFSEMVDKTNNWSALEAKLMLDAGHPPMNIPRFLTAMGREFWHRMIVKKAFLDGKVGIMFAMYQVFSRFVSYAKLWEMQITKK